MNAQLRTLFVLLALEKRTQRAHSEWWLLVNRHFVFLVILFSALSSGCVSIGTKFGEPGCEEILNSDRLAITKTEIELQTNIHGEFATFIDCPNVSLPVDLRHAKFENDASAKFRRTIARSRMKNDQPFDMVISGTIDLRDEGNGTRRFLNVTKIHSFSIIE